MEFIDLHQQYNVLKQAIDKRVLQVLSHGQYIMGPEVFELEEQLADYVGVKHAITCANGTDALQLSLMALNIGEGDAVFCPTFTFFATAEVIGLSKATPVFVDSESSGFNLCVAALEREICSVLKEGRLKPKAIIAVDLFGLPADYMKLEKLAKKYGLYLIEDAAQGFGGEIFGQKAGSFGDIATTSFFPAKPLGCYGDGGAIFTDSDELAELIRSYRVHGKGKDKYDNVRIGLNSRLDTIQAAILLEKLRAFPDEVVARNLVAKNYSANLAGKYALPNIPEGWLSSWAQYTLIDERRDALVQHCKSNSIPVAIYYEKCMHEQTAFSYLDCTATRYPRATVLASSVFSLPMHPYLRKEQQGRVIEVLSSQFES